MHSNNYKQLMATMLFAVVCLAVYSLFPVADDLIQSVILALFFLLVIPVLYIKMILKEPLSRYGLSKGKEKRGLLLAAGALPFSILIVYLLINYTAFSEQYSFPSEIKDNFGLFVAYEVLLVGGFTVLYEFFFRGFVLFSLFPLGAWSIAAQGTLMVAFMYFSSAMQFSWPLVPYAIIAFFAGIIAHQSRSIIYSLAYSFLFSVMLDVLVIAFQK